MRARIKIERTDTFALSMYYRLFEYYQYAQPDSAIIYLEQASKQFSATGYVKGVASVLNMMGRISMNQGNVNLAIKQQRQALAVFEEANGKRGIGVVHNSLGVIEGSRGNLDSATSHFIQALKANEEAGYIPGIISSYINLGRINTDFGDYEKALSYYNKGLDLIADSNEVENRSTIYNNIGTLYGQKGDLNTAMRYLQKALAISDRHTNVSAHVNVLMNMGIVYTHFGKNDKALQVMNEALTVARESKVPDLCANILVNIAIISGQTDPRKAITQLEEALIIAKQLGNKLMLREIYSGLADMNKKTGDYKQVVLLLEERMKYEDSTFNVEKSKAVASIQAVYELEESKNNIKGLKLREQTNLLKRNILGIVIGSLAVVLIVIIVFYRKTKAYNGLLSLQKNELQSLNKTKDHLFSIIGHDLRGPVGNITLIMDELEDDTNSLEFKKELLYDLRGEAQGTMETLDKLLSWGSGQIKGSAAFHPTAIDANKEIRKNIDVLAVSVRRKQVVVKFHPLAANSIIADPDHFDFVVRNLLSNALKYSSAGGIIEITADRDQRPGYTVFAFRDTGVGLTTEQLSQLFSARYNSTRGTANEKGTGIGLMLCRQYITQNGGDLWAESVSGIGATFFVRLRNV